MPDGRLEGRVAIITGAAGGIGAATARAFLREGAAVVLADLAEERLEQLARELGANARAARCDVGSPTDIATAVSVATDAFGRVDVMVNNAALGSAGAVADLQEDEWARLLRINVGGAINGIGHGAAAMRAHGEGGSIINISSLAAHRAMAGLGLYGACKAAVESLTRTAAHELRSEGIRVNAIVPGVIRTIAAEASAGALTAALGQDLDTWIATRQARWGTADEVAAVAVHLASDEASFTSGLLYHVDNGAHGV